MRTPVIGTDVDFYPDGTPEKEKAITIYDALVTVEELNLQQYSDNMSSGASKDKPDLGILITVRH